MAKSRVTAQEIKLAKTLDEAGLSKGKIAKIVKRAYSTVDYMLRSKDLADYQKIVNADYEKKKAIKEAGNTDLLSTQSGQERIVGTSIADYETISEVQHLEAVLIDRLNTITSVLKAIEYKLPDVGEYPEGYPYK